MVAISRANVPHCCQLLLLWCEDWNLLFIFCGGVHLCLGQLIESHLYFLVSEASLRPEAAYLRTGKRLRRRSKTSIDEMCSMQACAAITVTDQHYWSDVGDAVS